MPAFLWPKINCSRPKYAKSISGFNPENPVEIRKSELGKIPRPTEGTFAFRNHILNQIPKQLKECQVLQDNKRVSPLLLDELRDNADRRIAEERWEDANARLYALLERFLQYRLSQQHHLNTSGCRPQDLPTSLREDFTRTYQTQDGLLRFGCLADAQLLSELQDPLFQDITELQQLEKLLIVRNQSILAHGTRPVQREDVGQMTAFLYPKLERLLTKV